MSPPIADAKVRKPRHRWRPGTVALREIRRYQMSTNTLVPRAPMRRLIREIMYDINPELRLKDTAASAMHECAEAFLIKLLSDTNLMAIHTHRVTIQPRDMSAVRFIRDHAASTTAK
jgi:histone H3